MKINYKKEWNNLLNIANDILIKIKKKNIQAEIKININNNLLTHINMGMINEIKYNNNKMMIINIYKNNSKATIFTSDFNKKSLINLINTGINITKNSKKNDYEIPYNKNKNLNYNLNIYHPKNNILNNLMEYNKKYKKYFFYNNIINLNNYNFEMNDNFKIYCNTNNFFISYPSSMYLLYSKIILQNKEKIKNYYKYIKIRDLNDIDNILNKKYIENLSNKNIIKNLLKHKIKPSIQPIILSSNIASIFLNNFIKAIYGYNIYNKKSFLSNYLNKKIFSKNITIYEEPHIKKAIGSKPFDEEGINTQFKLIVKNGYLKNYLLDTYYSKKLNMKNTGNSGGISNIIISNDNITLKNLIKNINKGILVTELFENETNIISGIYSYEIFGYLINKGIIEYSIQKAIITGNFLETFLNIIYISNDINNYEKIQTGSILINNVKINNI
ncbi:MAG TPA: TldD/PmbA family protein [Candidatus Azosocius sp. HAIN]